MAVASRIRAKKLPSRVAGRRQPNLAGAIYGTIVATAVVAGLGEASTSPVRALLLLCATVVFLWAAHVYALLLAERINGRHRMKRADIARVMALERPLLYAGLPLALPLAAGSLGLIGTGLSLGLALLVGVLALVGWGAVFARREGQGPTGIITAALLNGVVGFIIVALKAAVH
jgi:uncharacterized membrane protein